MHELITGFVGLDAHAGSTAIAVAEVGREVPRFVGTVGARLSELTKALSRLGEPQCLQVVYEAGPCGYTLARSRQSTRCRLFANLASPQLKRIPRLAGRALGLGIRPHASFSPSARWQSGHAAACKAVYAGSIPTLAFYRNLIRPSQGVLPCPNKSPNA